MKKEAGTKRRKWKKNVYEFIFKEEDSWGLTSHVHTAMFRTISGRR